MPKICYKPKRFSASSLALIEQANAIITEYVAKGFTLTLRQLYYQFVARDLILNRDSEYKRLGSIINDARLAGLIDWNVIKDRTRELKSNNHWNSPEDIIKACADQYQKDRWRGQPYRPEVWIEKDALVGVIAPTCEKLDVPYFACRGYTSQSEMWVGAQRMRRWLTADHTPVVLHLGDHDPSGIDMTRDIMERLELFSDGIEVRRLALNMDQVEQYGPPPNPAKTTDSRFIGYIRVYGEDSWELDALDPQTIADLIEGTVLSLRDEEAFAEVLTAEEGERAGLAAAADKWTAVMEFLKEV